MRLKSADFFPEKQWGHIQRLIADTLCSPAESLSPFNDGAGHTQIFGLVCLDCCSVSLYMNPPLKIRKNKRKQERVQRVRLYIYLGRTHGENKYESDDPLLRECSRVLGCK